MQSTERDTTPTKATNETIDESPVDAIETENATAVPDEKPFFFKAKPPSDEKKAMMERQASERLAAIRVAAERAESARQAELNPSTAEQEYLERKRSEDLLKQEEANAEAERAKAEAQKEALRKEAEANAEAKRSKLASMSEEELIAMHLEDKITADRQWSQGQLQTARAGLQANEDEMKQLDTKMAEDKEVHSRKASDLEEQRTSMTTVLSGNVTLHQQCTALADEIASAGQMFLAGLEDKKTIRARVETELAEAVDRLGAQQERSGAVLSELTRFTSETAPVIAKKAVELMRLSSDAAAKMCSLEAFKKTLADLTSQLEVLEEQVADTADIDSKSVRAELTASEISFLKERIAADDADIAGRILAERDLDEADRLEDASHAKTRRALVSDVEGTKMLIELEKAALQESTSMDEASMTPTHKRLREQTNNVLQGRKAKSDDALKELNEAVEQHDREVASARADREIAMIQMRAERVAIEIAHEQRKRFLEERERQHEVEVREIDKGRSALLDRQHAIDMLKMEIKEAEAGVAKREKLAVAAAKLRDDKDAALKQMKLDSKTRENAIAVRLSCEREVEARQKEYTTQIKKRLKMESEVDSHAEKVNMSSEGGASAVLQAPIGKRSLGVVHANNDVQSEWIADLKQQLAECESEVNRNEMQLLSSQKAFTRSRSLLTEQHTAMVASLSKLADYESNLHANLPSNPASPRSVSNSLKSTPVKRASLMSPRKELFRDDSTDVVTPSQTSLPTKEVLSTPYAAAHKYLADAESALPPSPPPEVVEPVGTPTRKPEQMLEKISQQILSEQNHPLYNPDLKLDRARSWARPSSMFI